MTEMQTGSKIFPIVGYGNPVLRRKAAAITASYQNLKEIIERMFATMYASEGVGLAAPQVNLPIRLFIVDAGIFAEEEPELKDFKRVFINAEKLDEAGEEWIFNEGCLSIPGIREDVARKPEITIQYMDENFKTKKETFTGMVARIIQHEYDHIEGILFVDHLSGFKRRLLKGKLDDIMAGRVNVKYRMKFNGK
ncbi:MAG: peptide deformylase [Bacteroidia bacterium]|nr:peptide deformylase [Bacteroidia bacterium]